MTDNQKIVSLELWEASRRFSNQVTLLTFPIWFPWGYFSVHLCGLKPSGVSQTLCELGGQIREVPIFFHVKD